MMPRQTERQQMSMAVDPYWLQHHGNRFWVGSSQSLCRRSYTVSVSGSSRISEFPNDDDWHTTNSFALPDLEFTATRERALAGSISVGEGEAAIAIIRLRKELDRVYLIVIQTPTSFAVRAVHTVFGAVSNKN